MASVVSHFVIGPTLALPFTAVPSVRGAVRPIGLMFSAGLLAAAPDLDTAFFGVIPYAHFFGHRGFFHSPFFAISFALILSFMFLTVSRSFSIRTSMLVYPFGETRPKTLTLSPPLDEEGRALVTIGFLAYHKAVPVIDFRYLGGVIITYITDGLPQQVRVDWELFTGQIQRVPATAIDPAGPLMSYGWSL